MCDLYATLPKRVRVGPYSYRFRVVTEADPKLGEDVNGMTHFSEGEVYFHRALTADVLLNTVLHEVGHCINHAYGVGDGVEEEVIATQSANGWMQVYLDNPRLHAWINRAVRFVRAQRSEQ